ncbi:Stromal cell-derived factor 2-like protein [Tritrichomonas foetus]|uniref:Stromal cell-derived factor 2-like protein n=1 Tax=Tritrichomonas foetus TaxID=1144522 RepID=A0A1J4KY91_9EUKA|nr:Stromal cell-derived factor 2-like protein [Tritrichomonas foetus]|eukprot:OHT16225.1 Stromal cell-derived factor 2-like protein [Tritrichomonas foetus]
MFGFFLYVAIKSYETYSGEKDEVPVAYYNMIKLKHTRSEYLLSSIELPYQQGSNQQLVRAIHKVTLAETFWTVYPPANETDEVPQGKPVECGSVIRLNHATTGKWLHSHKIPGHFGSGYEVTCFDGSDSGDNWLLECNDMWTLGSVFRLKHIDTGFYLAANETSEYPKEEAGEHEIYAAEEDEGNEWQIVGGIFVDENEDQ